MKLNAAAMATAYAGRKARRPMTLRPRWPCRGSVDVVEEDGEDDDDDQADRDLLEVDGRVLQWRGESARPGTKRGKSSER